MAKYPPLMRYNWKPDLPDFRDHMYSFIPTAATVLPKVVDLRPHCSAIENQGNLGSCTGNAIVGALEFLENKENSEAVAAGGTAKPFVNLSRLFLYYQERVIENTVNQDSGAQIRDGVKACNTIGVCAESLYPYVVSKFKAKPTAKATADAANRKISEYLRITDLTSLRSSIAAGFPVVFGFTVYESFESDAVAKTGLVPMPQPSEQVLGGHAVMAMGYDDNKQLLKVRNSWGAAWGDQGYFYMPYAYITTTSLSDDFWTIRK